MTTYKLFANVNPLEPNCLLCVMTSTQLCMSNLDAKAYLQLKGRELLEKGYKVELECYMTHKCKF